MNGLFIAEQDARDLAEGIVTLANDPALRSRMSEANRQKYANYYNIEHYGQRVAAVFDELLSRQRGVGEELYKVCNRHLIARAQPARNRLQPFGCRCDLAAMPHIHSGHVTPAPHQRIHLEQPAPHIQRQRIWVGHFLIAAFRSMSAQHRRCTWHCLQRRLSFLPMRERRARRYNAAAREGCEKFGPMILTA